MALELNTYGDLKKVIKAISLKQKGEKIGNIALGTLMGFIPGADAAKTTFDFIKAAISKPDIKKTNTWLDKLDIDDEMSAIVDDTVENGFMQMITKSIESESDDKPLESDFNMNAKMVDYLKSTYKGRTVAGIKENKIMDIKEYIKNIVREIISEDELEEMSVSGDAGAYSTPYAFRGNKKGENAATKAAISQGFKKASTSLPKNSKVVDYVKLFEDEYEMNQDPKTKEFTKRVKLSDKDKETVKKIQALMAKQKKTINEKVYDFKYKLGDTFKINNIPSDIDPAYADVKIGDEIKIIKVWSNLAGPVYGTNVSEKTGLNEKDIEKMTSNNSIKEGVNMKELEDTLKRVKKDNPGKIISYFFTKDDPKGYKISIDGKHIKENIQNIIKEDIQNNFEVKVGDTLENIRTGVLTKIKSIKGNNITGVIIDLGDGSIPNLKMGDVNKTNKLLINKTYKLISSIDENIQNIIKEEILKEGTYSKFKNEVKLRSKNEMLHKAIKEVKRKLMEIDRIVEYTSMMKQELSEGEEGLNYWKATTNNVSRIAEMVNELNLKIQNLQQ